MKGDYSQKPKRSQSKKSPNRSSLANGFWAHKNRGSGFYLQKLKLTAGGMGGDGERYPA